MNIIIPDIDIYIIKSLDLPELTNLMLVNKFFHNEISIMPIVKQWTRSSLIREAYNRKFFIAVCVEGFFGVC